MVEKSISQWTDALVNEGNVKVTISLVPADDNPNAEYDSDWIIQSGGGGSDVDVSALALEATLVKMVPIAKANVFNSAPPGANTDILGADITPTNSPSICRTSVVLGVDSVFKATVTQGATALNAYLNDGVALTSGSLYVFDIPWESGDSLNYQIETDGMVQVLKAHEVGA